MARQAAILVVAMSLPLWAGAQERGSDRGVLARQLQNPVTDLAQLTIFNDNEFGLANADEYAVVLTVMPQFPLAIAEGWRVTVWTITRLGTLPPREPEGQRLNGIGDTILRLPISPARPRQGAFWGAGPAFLLPTATKNELGAGAFGLGAVGVLGYQGRPWTAAVVAHHVHSVREGRGRDEVRRSAIRPYLSWTSPSGVSLNVDSESRVDWERTPGDRWLVPIGLTLGQVGTVGEQSINLEVGARYFIESPVGGPDWGMRLVITFLFPVRAGEPPPTPEEAEASGASAWGRAAPRVPRSGPRGG